MGTDVAVIHLNEIEHGEAIADRIGIRFVPRVDRTISITSHGNLIGGVVYTDYTQRTIQIHGAAWIPRALTRDLLWTVFTYPFDVLRVERVLAYVATTNERSTKLCLGVGFKEHALIRDVVPDGHMMVLSMGREDCRWLKWRPRYLDTEKGASNGRRRRQCTTST